MIISWTDREDMKPARPSWRRQLAVAFLPLLLLLSFLIVSIVFVVLTIVGWFWQLVSPLLPNRWRVVSKTFSPRRVLDRCPHCGGMIVAVQAVAMANEQTGRCRSCERLYSRSLDGPEWSPWQRIVENLVGAEANSPHQTYGAQS